MPAAKSYERAGMNVDNLHGFQEEDATGRISVLVVDDHPVLRFGVVSLLENEPDFDVIGAAENCAEAGRLADAHDPDIVLLDRERDESEGVDAPSRRSDQGAAKIIIFTAHKDDERILQAVRIGISGYVMKGAPNGRLCEAIRIVARGGMYLDPAVAPKVTALLSGRDRREPVFAVLSERETTVLNSIATGKRNKQIAAELFISERTVKFHASSIFSKLGATNRTEAVKIAVAHHLICL